MKKVMVFGTFDILHPGHINFFRQAKKYGDYLIVVVARDLNVKKIKGELPIDNEAKRRNNIKKLKIVNEVILGDLKDKFRVIEKKKPNVICLGYDQKDFSLNNELDERKLNIKVIRLRPHKPEIYKSSILKLQAYRNKNKG